MAYSFVDCPADTWTLVATAVQRGNIYVAKKGHTYLQAYKATGAPPPVDDSEGIPFIQPGQEIKAPVDTDIYLYSKGEDGKVRVDL
jgi:hypothetical protein